MIIRKKIIALLLRVNLYLVALLGIMYLLQKKFIHEYRFDVDIEPILKIILLASIIFLPIIISFYTKKYLRLKVYLLINIIPCVYLITMDWISSCTDICIRGFVSIGALVYYVVMLIIFSVLNRFIQTD